ncbi:1-acyl-sn-glycerol-3-phosphate acyltransferase [Massilia sp. TS11]|uniref:1-acyl-sn-glycerol-3-phosphate acyltransferase n=1 Tax=Massilia sp. TS11 TaxID=2908003 RepID=UPI001EDB1542|nr:1-acyl-sn-glycerol-3-phosphate acyltransferase [Massilia sp. TS11]MCG2584483.1 1-acyl-sn-glycerol-3-phosphate acyltransferase [Massilia sp. TS11]
MTDTRLQPEQLPRWGQRAALRILNAFGWNMRFKPLPGPHGVAIVYPHTSNWDFFVGLLGKWALGLPFRWLGKDSLFKGPIGSLLGPFMRAWGGMPVERHASTGAIERLAAQIKAEPWCWLALAPEGTRSYKPYLRSGFYHIAVAAKVPLLVVYLDYKRKELGVVDCLELSGDPQRDLAAIAAVYADRPGLHPELAAPIQFKDS